MDIMNGLHDKNYHVHKFKTSESCKPAEHSRSCKLLKFESRGFSKAFTVQVATVIALLSNSHLLHSAPIITRDMAFNKLFAFLLEGLLHKKSFRDLWLQLLPKLDL